MWVVVVVVVVVLLRCQVFTSAFWVSAGMAVCISGRQLQSPDQTSETQ